MNELKALKPIFAHAHRLRIIAKDPTRGLKMDRPETEDLVTAGAEEIATFQERWKVGTIERLVFDLALYTPAARIDLVALSRRNISHGVLSYTRQKTKVVAQVPITPELRAEIDRTLHIAPAFLLSTRGELCVAESIGNLFRDAANEVGMVACLHGLRKAFCVYWAVKCATTHQIAAMAGHMTSGEVERYTVGGD